MSDLYSNLSDVDLNRSKQVKSLCQVFCCTAIATQKIEIASEKGIRRIGFKSVIAGEVHRIFVLGNCSKTKLNKRGDDKRIA